MIAPYQFIVHRAITIQQGPFTVSIYCPSAITIQQGPLGTICLDMKELSQALARNPSSKHSKTILPLVEWRVMPSILHNQGEKQSEHNMRTQIKSCDQRFK